MVDERRACPPRGLLIQRVARDAVGRNRGNADDGNGWVGASRLRFATRTDPEISRQEIKVNGAAPLPTGTIRPQRTVGPCAAASDSINGKKIEGMDRCG